MQRRLDDFRRMVEEHQRMVFGIAVRLLRDAGEAEEVAQDVFLELYDALPRLKSADHARFWLRRVAVHRTTDAMRRRANRPEVLAEMWQDDLHAKLEKGELCGVMATRLEDMVRSLPEPYRTAVVLRYGEDAGPEEIALIVGRPVATVKSHLQRGLEMLRRKSETVLKEWTR